LSVPLAKKNIGMQTDSGGEYQKLNSLFQNFGITYLVSCPHAYQQNGLSEHKHRHIVEVGYLVSCPHAYQQNGPSERKHKHIVEVGLHFLHMPLCL
jgi:hypothetical protein